jgi:hypothetical protein
MFKAPSRRREDLAHPRPERLPPGPAALPLPKRPAAWVHWRWAALWRWPHLRGPRRTGLALAVLSFWLGLFWAAATHPLAAPDEPAHLLAVMQVRNYHILPEVHYDFSRNPHGEVVNTPVDPATYAYIVAQGSGDAVRLIPSESFHPPLYYLTAGILTQALPADPQAILYASRLITVLFGAVTVYFCWAAAREFAPGAPLWAGATAAVITLLPQFCFNRAAVSNDTAVNCLGAVVFYVWFRGLRQPGYDPWMLRAGVAGGLAVLASLSGAVLLPGLGLVILFRAFQVGAGVARLRRAGRMLAGAGVAGLLVAVWWPLRNLIVYGEPTGLQNVVQYAKVTYPLLDFRTPDTQALFLKATWESFWGVFGWMDNRLPDLFYDQARLFSAIALSLSLLAGLIQVGRRLLRGRRWPTHTWQATLVMGVVAVTLAINYLQFSVNVGFQAQGRLLFLLLLPAGLLFTGGLYALAPGRGGKILALSVPILWLAGMNAVGLVLIR